MQRIDLRVKQRSGTFKMNHRSLAFSPSELENSEHAMTGSIGGPQAQETLQEGYCSNAASLILDLRGPL